jgi:hypothetical protein
LRVQVVWAKSDAAHGKQHFYDVKVKRLECWRVNKNARGAQIARVIYYLQATYGAERRYEVV